MSMLKDSIFFLRLPLIPRKTLSFTTLVLRFTFYFKYCFSCTLISWLHTRGTRYCWAWGHRRFETNKWAMFLETEASIPYCNWSTKMAGIIWFGSKSVQDVNNWQRLSHLPFLSLCKSRKFLETKTYSFICIEKTNICKKNDLKNIWCKYGLHNYLPQA